MESRNWNHPAETVCIKETQDNTTYDVEIYTDGSKTGEMVGAAAAIFQQGTLIRQLKYRLNGKCSNNQAEQIAILSLCRSLQQLHTRRMEEKLLQYICDSRPT